MRCDYVFLSSRSRLTTVLAARVADVPFSDHLPLVIELGEPPPSTPKTSAALRDAARRQAWRARLYAVGFSLLLLLLSPLVIPFLLVKRCKRRGLD